MCIEISEYSENFEVNIVIFLIIYFFIIITHNAVNLSKLRQLELLGYLLNQIFKIFNSTKGLNKRFQPFSKSLPNPLQIIHKALKQGYKKNKFEEKGRK